MGSESINLQRVLYVPNFGKNILSINKILDKGGEMTGNKDEMTIVIKNKNVYL